MQLQIKKLYVDSIIPTRGYPTDSGLDLTAYLGWNFFKAQDEEGNMVKEIYDLQPGQRVIVPTGIAIKLPEPVLNANSALVAYEAQIRPRSGLAAKQGLTIVNSPGTIDSQFTGQVQVILLNTGDKAILIKHGMKIAQLVVCPVMLPTVVEVDELGVTDRGSNGFGSTGV